MGSWNADRFGFTDGNLVPIDSRIPFIIKSEEDGQFIVFNGILTKAVDCIRMTLDLMSSI
jgi:hypothetical protein